MAKQSSSVFPPLIALHALSDLELTAQLHQLVKRGNALEAELLLHLAEVEVRGLFCAAACSSMFTYCVQRLGFSEEVAYKRVGAARIARRFPLAVELLVQNKLHLTALLLVKPQLTDDNHRDWLLAACGKTKREVEKLVAARCPKPDIASTVRRQPTPRSTLTDLDPSASDSVGESLLVSVAQNEVPPELLGHGPSTNFGENERVMESVPQDLSGAKAIPTTTSESVDPGPLPAVANMPAIPKSTSQIRPLSAASYRFTFTATEALKQKIERAQALVSHTVPPSDLPALFERAIDLLIEREEKRRFAIGVKPRHARHEEIGTNDASAWAFGETERTSAESTAGSPERRWVEPQQDPDPAEGHAAEPSSQADRPKLNSRYIPASVRRVVWQRDGGRCSFVDEQGHRCTERRFLELEHRVPHCRGGAPSVENLCLYCKSHNAYRAELTFGHAHMQTARNGARCRSTDLGAAVGTPG